MGVEEFAQLIVDPEGDDGLRKDGSVKLMDASKLRAEMTQSESGLRDDDTLELSGMVRQKRGERDWFFHISTYSSLRIK